MWSFSDFNPQYISLVSPRNFARKGKLHVAAFLAGVKYWSHLGYPQKCMIHPNTSWPMKTDSMFGVPQIPENHGLWPPKRKIEPRNDRLNCDPYYFHFPTIIPRTVHFLNGWFGGSPISGKLQMDDFRIFQDTMYRNPTHQLTSLWGAHLAIAEVATPVATGRRHRAKGLGAPPQALPFMVHVPNRYQIDTK